MSHRRHAWRKDNRDEEEPQVHIKQQNKNTTTKSKEVNGMIRNTNTQPTCKTMLCRTKAMIGESHCLKHKPKGQKLCANIKCKNQAPKDSIFCGLHRPKVKGATQGAYSKVGCHKGNVLVFTTPEGIEVYGGGSSREGGWWVMNPLPDLAIGPKEIVNKAVNAHKFPKGWLVDSIAEPAVPIVALDFPDYSIPKNLGKVFWLSLVEDIYTHGVKRISCQCMGGHGRTGVQLCILAHYLLPDSQHEWKDAGELIDWVRKHMCIHEVEARKQQDYISEVCDIPIGEYKVASSRYSSAYSGGTNWNFDGTQWSSVANNLDDDFGDSDGEGDAVGGIHSALQSDIDLDLDDMVSPKVQTSVQSFGNLAEHMDDSPVEEDDIVYECMICDVREIWSVGTQLSTNNGYMKCLDCGGDMIDITDLPETQEDIRMWIIQQDLMGIEPDEVGSSNLLEEEQAHIKRQQEDE